MSKIEVEVYREDVDDLTAAILAVVTERTGTLPEIDRAVIVAAALASVACRVDVISIDIEGGVVADSSGVTGRLHRCVEAWKWREA